MIHLLLVVIYLAFIGTCLMPPFFGLIAQNISISLFSAYLLIILILMVIAHERVVRKAK